jgi:hypothetical protein
VPTPDDHGKASPRGRVLQEPLRAGEERGSDGDGKEQDQLMKRLDRVSSLSKKGCVSHVRHVLVVV